MDFEGNAGIMGRFCKHGTVINHLDSEQSLPLFSFLSYKVPAALNTEEDLESRAMGYISEDL